jgi:hypothetical protein
MMRKLLQLTNLTKKLGEQSLQATKSVSILIEELEKKNGKLELLILDNRTKLATTTTDPRHKWLVHKDNRLLGINRATLGFRSSHH